MFNHRIRIFSSLLIAFIIVNLYGRLSTTPFISPIEADNIKNLLSSLKFNPNSITRLFTIDFGLTNNNSTIKQLNNQNNASVDFTKISTKPTQPIIVQTPNLGVSTNPTTKPCTGQTCLTPTILIPTTKITPTKIPTKIPTNIPKPTNTPKPTKVPTPPPITSDIRPGTSLMTIFQEVGKRACIPAALLMAFKTEETGERFKNDSATTIKIYNTYGWWQTGAGDPCYGYGYNTATGFVPSDSVSAGTHCWGGAGGADLKIMGLLQISEEEETLTRKYTKKTLPNNIDRRVFFDNALIFAIATNNRIGVTPKSCTVWTDDEVQIAAEKHYGSCYISATRNYCNEVLNLYKQYR
ncbi:MAG: hypothetical protein AAB569_01615 [Patescibacteria group bacterium]